MHQIQLVGRAPSRLAAGVYNTPRPPSWVSGSLHLRERYGKGVEARGRGERTEGKGTEEGPFYGSCRYAPDMG